MLDLPKNSASLSKLRRVDEYMRIATDNSPIQRNDNEQNKPG